MQYLYLVYLTQFYMPMISLMDSLEFLFIYASPVYLYYKKICLFFLFLSLFSLLFSFSHAVNARVLVRLFSCVYTYWFIVYRNTRSYGSLLRWLKFLNIFTCFLNSMKMLMSDRIESSVSADKYRFPECQLFIMTPTNV